MPNTLPPTAVGTYQPPAAGPPPPPPLTAEEVGMILRALRWAWTRRAAIALLLSGVGAGAAIRPEYVSVAVGAADPPPIASEVRGELAKLHKADSQMQDALVAFRHFADSSRADRADLRRQVIERTGALGRGICAGLTPAQREISGLPCQMLLTGGTWDPRGTP